MGRSSTPAEGNEHLVLALLARDEQWTDEAEVLAVARWLTRELGSADAAVAWLADASAPAAC